MSIRFLKTNGIKTGPVMQGMLDFQRQEENI